MNFFTRLSNGWSISMNSFKVLRENKQLIIFPILSGIALLLVMGSFVAAILGFSGWDNYLTENQDQVKSYSILFLYYVLNYFVIVFFNTALIHCTRLYFKGEEVSVGKGLQFASSRIAAIFSWAVVAATVGTILRIIEENVGWLGKIIVSLTGVAWSIATFFVVPVIAYEGVGPFEAFRRSAKLMKEKWGESLGATFSFAIIQFIGILIIAVPLFILGSMVNFILGLLLGGLALFIIMAVMGAVQSIFISAVYHNVTGDPVEHFRDQLVDGLFATK